MPSANPPPPWPSLWPLRESFVENPVEDELRQLFVALYDEHIAVDAADANVLGMAHLGSEALIQKFMQVDGLALPKRSKFQIYAYLYRAWKGRNSGRGLHFLRTVLQLFFPGQWAVSQMAQRKEYAYPTALSPRQDDENPAVYLTSRLSISVSAAGENGTTLSALAPILRAILPARFVPRFSVATTGVSGFVEASLGSSVMIIHTVGQVLPVQYNSSTGVSKGNMGTPLLVIQTQGTTQ